MANMVKSQLGPWQRSKGNGRESGGIGVRQRGIGKLELKFGACFFLEKRRPHNFQFWVTTSGRMLAIAAAASSNCPQQVEGNLRGVKVHSSAAQGARSCCKGKTKQQIFRQLVKCFNLRNIQMISGKLVNKDIKAHRIGSVYWPRGAQREAGANGARAGGRKREREGREECIQQVINYKHWQNIKIQFLPRTTNKESNRRRERSRSRRRRSRRRATREDRRRLTNWLEHFYECKRQYYEGSLQVSLCLSPSSLSPSLPLCACPLIAG